MKDTKFTPGPWEIEYDNSETGQWYQSGPAIVHFRYNSNSQIKAKANAHLIAAAPDMFEALRILTADNFAMQMTEEGKKAIGIAALKKACGGS